MLNAILSGYTSQTILRLTSYHRFYRLFFVALYWTVWGETCKGKRKTPGSAYHKHVDIHFRRRVWPRYIFNIYIYIHIYIVLQPFAVHESQLPFQRWCTYSAVLLSRSVCVYCFCDAPHKPKGMCSFVWTNGLVREIISQIILFVEQTNSLAKYVQTNKLIREPSRTPPNIASPKFP